jgi:hypothetical protein
MNLKQQYAGLAGVLIGEAFAFVLLASIALYLPAAGAAGFLAATVVVYYYSARHPTPFGVIAGLFNTLLLIYFGQCRGLPTALLFLLVSGASPYIEQLSPGLARVVFTAAYTITVLLLALLANGNVLPGVGIMLGYILLAIVTGFAAARYFIRPSSLEPIHG